MGAAASRLRIFSARIFNAAATQEAEFVHATHTYLHARANATEEWSQIWSQCDDVSWAHAFGRMRGFKNVWNGSVTCYDVQATQRFQGSYEAMLDFAEACAAYVQEVVLSTVATTLTKEEEAQCAEICRRHGVTYRIRPWEG